jgi:hypothetical protein
VEASVTNNAGRRSDAVTAPQRSRGLRSVVARVRERPPAWAGHAAFAWAVLYAVGVRLYQGLGGTIGLAGAFEYPETMRAAISRKSTRPPTEIELNGELGLVLASGDGQRAALSFVVSDGRITRIDAIRNPEKLRHL